MPFKLKLKKTRQYNVASKNLYVISVEVLDGGVADCTLSVDSTGQECLDNVCQRQGINQPEFFGLRYINTSQQPRWVQLERPLKRQLDKYASSHQLYLCVMYYVVSGTSLLTDEMTRYHYFLQLKNDLIEGRIICDCQQAVILASYSHQAEYGNHDRERHTVEYLKNLLPFPKQLIDGGQVIDGSALAESGRLEWMTSAVIQHHKTLHNMSQAQAEERFFTACQQLRGYGQEMFLAKEQRSQGEVTIAVSLTGIMLLGEASDTPHFYRWMDITNVINHKRTFSIECAKATDSATFVLPSPEDGKYVWRLCVQQHTFYMRHQRPLSEAPAAAQHQTNFQEHGLSDSRQELDVADEGRLQRAHSTSCLEPTRTGQLVPSYRPAPDYETAIQQKYQQQRAEAQLRFQNHHTHNPMSNKPLVYGSHPDIHATHYPDVTRHTLSQTNDDYAFGMKYLAPNTYPFAVNPNVQTDLNPQLHYMNVYKPPPPYPSNGLASNSTPDLAAASQALNYRRGYINAHVSGSSPDLVSTRTALNRQFLGYINQGNVMVNHRHNIVPSTHGTFTNLNSVLDPNPHIILDPHHVSDNIQKAYDERGNIMYSMPMHRLPYQHVVLPQQTQAMSNRTEQEPIYENVPLVWREQNKVTTIRDRAQSLTTTDEINRLNERNSSHPSINYGLKQNLNVPGYHVPTVKIDSPDAHYVNAQAIKDARESSVPKDLNKSSRSINKDQFENIALNVERMSINEKDDETPYQSLSTHKLTNSSVLEKRDNVTSISVPDVRDFNSNTSATDSALTASIINSTFSTTDLETSGSTTKSGVSSKASVSSKEKKRRRWGVFMGRGSKGEVKSATLGRDRTKPTNPATNKHRWSTGLPKSQPLPPSISKETMCQLLERRMADDQLAFAFEQIPKGREKNAEMTTALLPEYSHINGFTTDFLPYEDNRVRLKCTTQNPHGYINASHITLTNGSSQQFYALAKVPSSQRCRDIASLYWECCWTVGAMVCAHVGPVGHFVPADGATQTYGRFRVKVEWQSAAPWGGTRRVLVWRSTGAGAGGLWAGGAGAGAGGAGGLAPRGLWLVCHNVWQGDSPPNLAHFTAFLSEVTSLAESHPGGEASEAGEGGEVWAGAGGGAMLISDVSGQHAPLVLAARALTSEQEIDIPRTVGVLHQQRANMIQNIGQYKFLHQLLLHYLNQSRLI